MDPRGVAAAAATLCLASALCPGQDPAPAGAAEAELEFFESKVRPLLAEHCYECHASTSARVKADFRLDAREHLLRGGRGGPVVEPGDPEASRLIEAVRYAGELQMPPAGKLEPAEIALLEQWVSRGAAMPGEAASDPVAEPGSSPAHWSFQVMSDPVPPDVSNRGWCANEIDRFVLARLEAAGLAPAPRADRATLLRRLSFDLTGLPPTRAEIERFHADGSEGAWERELDRLLASPHYGERWGRAWLDLARYSDSNGLDENLAMSTAFRYRDWVVRALNDDLPYDKFLTLQLAGDLLPEPADEAALRDQLVATGFLVLGPKMLAEQDKEKLALDVVDEQIDVAFRTFQGLTLGCARCHDHKFDPVSQRDYTAVAGIFRSTATMANLAFVSRWNERELAPKAKVIARRAAEESIAKAKEKLAALRKSSDDTLLARWIARCDSYLLAATVAAREAVLVEAEEPSRGNLIRDDSTYGTAEVAVARTGGGGLQFAEYDLTFAESGKRVLEVHMAAEESRPMRVLLDGQVVLDAALGEKTGSWKRDGQRWQRIGVLELRAGRSVLRLERDGPVPHLDQLLLTPATEAGANRGWPVDGNPWASELEPALVRAWAIRMETAQHRADPVFGLWSRFAELAPEEFEARAAGVASALREGGALAAAANPLVLRLLDGLPPASLRELAARYQTLFAGVDAQWRELSAKDPKASRLESDAAEALRGLLHGDESLFHLPAAEIEPLYGEAQRGELAQARAHLEARERELPPAIDTALGVADAPEIAGLPVMRRGNHLDKGAEIVARGVPRKVAAGVRAPELPAGESGRLQLAQWMLDPEHPLTARVAVNRLWQGHFGFGLVRTASNFGLRGDAPSHPELLDWLARELVRRQWSLKAVHKLICMSSAYQCASDAGLDAQELDPENRLLSHQNRRRLDAEELRDALLAASGQLDRAVGGSLLEIKNGDYVTNDQSKDSARYDAPRRSLYLPIIRNSMLDLFSAFDYPDPSVTLERRVATTTASQALYLMNSPLVLGASTALARSVDGLDPDARIAGVYAAALCRPPSAREKLRAYEFLLVPALPEAAPPPRSDVGESSPAEPSEAGVRGAETRLSLLAQVLLMSNEFLYVD